MSKLYATALGDLALLMFSLLADIDPILRTVGLLVGLAVGIFTLVKLYHDIKLRRLEIEQRRSNDKS